MIPALPVDTSTYSFDPVFINAFLGVLINMMKHSNSRYTQWISDATPWLTRCVHAAVAAFSAAGMTLSYARADDGSMSVTLAGITLAGIGSFLFTMGKNFMMQAGTSSAVDGLRLLKEAVSWMREFAPLLSEIKQRQEKRPVSIEVANHGPA